MRTLYWDSCVLIYRLQDVEPWNRKIAVALSTLIQPKVVVSELSRLECRVKPLREGDLSTLATFDAFFAAPAIGYAPLSRPVFDLATDLRARYRLKTADAMHLAAAIVHGCDEFWTNDRRLDQAASGYIQTVSVEQLP
jgi:predicted nucleic acid-binding protein